MTDYTELKRLTAERGQAVADKDAMIKVYVERCETVRDLTVERDSLLLVNSQQAETIIWQAGRISELIDERDALKSGLDAFETKLQALQSNHDTIKAKLAALEGQEVVGCVAKDGHTILYFQPDALPFETDLYTAAGAKPAQSESDAEMALRSLANWLGVGGYNAPTVDAKVFEQKIRDGVSMLYEKPQTLQSAVDKWVTDAGNSAVNRGGAISVKRPAS